ncbi:nucleoside phosphorylase domain-containing protein [Aspergillus germanicus]
MVAIAIRAITICPLSRAEFEIALVCALRLEYDAVCLFFDAFWDEDGDRYGRALGDCNTYTTVAAASLHHSYQGLRLAILVGICGGVPFPKGAADEILLGDVVVSQSVIQDTIEDNLSRPNKDIRSLLAILESEHGRERLQQGTASYLAQLQDAARAKHRRTGYLYPGTREDKLFNSGYRHKHHDPKICICVCKDCQTRADPVCEVALTATCADLQCAASQLIHRRRLKLKAEHEVNKDNQAEVPAIHIGQIASGDTVVKSGEDRDILAQEMNVIAFEMEGAGVWDELPCIIVKGVADYADCHKNDTWQDYAAATAAAAMKALLDRYVRTDRVASPRI